MKSTEKLITYKNLLNNKKVEIALVKENNEIQSLININLIPIINGSKLRLRGILNSKL